MIQPWKNEDLWRFHHRIQASDCQNDSWLHPWHSLSRNTSIFFYQHWNFLRCNIVDYGMMGWVFLYGSIPINTIFSGMNIHLPAILMLFTRGTRFWPTAILEMFNRRNGMIIIPPRSTELRLLNVNSLNLCHLTSGRHPSLFRVSIESRFVYAYVYISYIYIYDISAFT